MTTGTNPVLCSVDELVDDAATQSGLDRARLADAFYVERGEAAVRHLLRVAAGLDSMVFGEPEIAGQVRAAERLARAHGRSGPVLGALFREALATGKEVRHRTGISREPASIASVRPADASPGDCRLTVRYVFHSNGFPIQAASVTIACPTGDNRRIRCVIRSMTLSVIPACAMTSIRNIH